MAEETKALLKAEDSNFAVRFTESVTARVAKTNEGLARLTDRQLQLIHGYFIGIDRTLKAVEQKRVKDNKNNKDHQYDNNLPYRWSSVDMDALAWDAYHHARSGLDMLEPNHLHPIPFKDNNRNCYTMNLMIGYSGHEYLAKNYAIDPPVSVTYELVYENDTFKALKKSSTTPYDTYVFEVGSPFDRGKCLGGFGYIEFDDPRKNKLIILTLPEIEKRKPEKASAKFWGSWTDEMRLKTLVRHVCKPKFIPRDPAKLDESYEYVERRASDYAVLEAQAEIDGNANTEPIDIEPVSLPEPEMTPASMQEVEEPEAVPEASPDIAPY